MTPQNESSYFGSQYAEQHFVKTVYALHRENFPTYHSILIKHILYIQHSVSIRKWLESNFNYPFVKAFTVNPKLEDMYILSPELYDNLKIAVKRHPRIFETYGLLIQMSLEALEEDSDDWFINLRKFPECVICKDRHIFEPLTVCVHSEQLIDKFKELRFEHDLFK